MSDLAEASGLTTERLQQIDDDELVALAESVLSEGGSGGAANTRNAGSSSGSSSVTYSSNTKKVAQAHGLPMNWAALDGIPAPPSLAEVPMSDEGLAAGINRAHGVEGPGDRVVTPSLVANARDKGVERGSTGVQVEDLAANDAGLDNNLDEEKPPPRHNRQEPRRGAHVANRAVVVTRRPSSAVSLEDLDGS